MDYSKELGRIANALEGIWKAQEDQTKVLRDIWTILRERM